MKALGGSVLGSTDAIGGYPSTLELVNTNITSITTTVEHQNYTLCPISSRPSLRFEKPTPKITLFNYADPTGREGGSGDADFDYLSNFLEYCEGLYPSHSIDLVNFNGGPYQKDFFPNAHDWDLDGMFDGYEVLMALKAKDNGTLYPEFGPSGNPDGDGFDLDLNGISK